MQRSLKWLAVTTTIVMIFILIGGALVTKTGSGMGCGRSWPLCNGRFIPTDINSELVIELAHRLVSGAGGFMVLILSIWSWKAIGHIRETKFLSFLSVFFLVLQGLIGAAAVVWGQSDFVLALHFGISLISFAAVFLLTLLIFEIDKKFDAENVMIDKRMKFHIIAISIYSYLVIYTGALVRHTKSSLVCRDWPLCLNDSPGLPDNMYQWVQMGHRTAAAILFLWIAYVTYLAIRYYKDQKVIYWGWIIAFTLVSLQVIAGALIIFSRLNLYIALLHALFITFLFGILSYFLLLFSRAKRY
ncbi:heme A synthase [Neobacillus sp. OS1-32]|uniref:Heme A synthase n=1 Tax=Neobacillus paridis TaxID=2803862 RepID=A0ABS1TMR9_9BACI|nr:MULTISPECIES: heme A synthase [Neobacillus]MBL4952547.1 heme A synthase [Neobacillus paridis]WML31935.1 heme A synthase [Neobacillus sp. OS1-32]